jgi:hypothetical protein
MIEGPVHVVLDSVQRTEPGELAVRVEGLGDEDEALRHRIAETLGRRRDPTERPAKQMRRQGRERGGIPIGITGPSTDPARRKELEDDLRDLLPEQRPAAQAAAAASVCVCAGGVHGDRINASPPFPWWDAAGNFLPPPSGTPPWVIAVSLDSAGWNWARLLLSDGAAASPPVPKSQVVVGLANSTSWAKEIWAQNFCMGRIASVFQSGTNTTPNRIRLDRAVCWSGADTIVFRKPGFWGIWHDVGHFGATAFWQAFGGTIADFTWVFD